MTRNKLQLFTHFKNCIILAIVQKISYFQLLDLVYFRSNRIIWMKLFSTTTGVIVGVGVCFSLNENNLVFLILILRFFLQLRCFQNYSNECSATILTAKIFKYMNTKQKQDLFLNLIYIVYVSGPGGFPKIGTPFLTHNALHRFTLLNSRKAYHTIFL